MLSKLNPLQWFRPKSGFTASAMPSDFQTSAAPMAPRPGPASPAGFMASASPQDFAAKVVGSYRYRAATSSERARMLRSAAETVASKPAASVAPLRSTPAKVAPVKPAPRKADWDKLNREMESLAALADRAVTRVRAEKERTEIASLTGLDKTRAGFKAQLAKSGLMAQSTGSAIPDGVGQESAAVKRSKPSQNPAFVPEPSQDVRLRECNRYYSELIAEIEVEYQAALKAGRIPQELLYRKVRTQKEWTMATDKILGHDIRK
jgi:DNA polymerase III gamma/tau subunit